eukprot:sb/3471873/
MIQTDDCISAWSPVIRDTLIPLDLESTPLQIKTDSTAGSGKQIWVNTYTTDGSFIGQVQLYFISPIRCYIYNCTSGGTSLTAQPRDEVDNIWTIRRTATALIIDCNGVEVLNYRFSEGALENCAPSWEGKMVKNIRFDEKDSASDSYRIECESVGLFFPRPVNAEGIHPDAFCKKA